MNPGTLTSPVQGEALSYAARRRAEGTQWDVIATELRAMTGKNITGHMVGAVVRRARKLDQAEALVKETKPTVRFDAQAQGLSEKRMVADPPRYEASPLRPRDGVVGDVSGVAVHTSKSRAEAYLLISDLQIPYHHPGALEFCKRVRFEFGVPLENVLCVGDETDSYWGSRFEKSADAPHTAQQEIDESAKELARWAAAFPHMRLCNSNHGGRWAKHASRVGIPKSMLRDYRELLGTPEGWRWADHWIVDASRQRFRIEHGHWKPGGHAGLRTRPLFRGMSTAFGHEHSEPAIMHLDTYGQSVWSMRVGSLISNEPLPAFEYNTDSAFRPTASVGVVLDGGRIPVIVRM